MLKQSQKVIQMAIQIARVNLAMSFSYWMMLYLQVLVKKKWKRLILMKAIRRKQKATNPQKILNKS